MPVTPHRNNLTQPDLADSIKAEALRLGFSSAGIADGAALSHRRRELSAWLARGLAGPLDYMRDFFDRQARFLQRLPEPRSVIVLAAPYAGQPEPAPATAQACGQVARYAVGEDYHRVIRKQLKQLETFIRRRVGPEARILTAVDTSPIQEKALAEAAGLGFIGKNTCLIHPRQGSYLFLGALLTNLDLPADPPIAWDCGNCTLCLQACPTHALVGPYQMDASRCIATLTIELRGDIDPALRPQMGTWLFGCDICQQVCPYNRPDPKKNPSHLPLETILSEQSDSSSSSDAIESLNYRFGARRCNDSYIGSSSVCRFFHLLWNIHFERIEDFYCSEFLCRS